MEQTLEVKIIQLEPMLVASFPAYGPEPEEEAWNRMIAWAKPLGLLEDPEKHRIFGFDTAEITPGSDNRGYEFWIEVAPGFQSVGDVKLIPFSGGKYAVYRIEKMGNPWETIPPAWKALVLWAENSPYKEGNAQSLEHHLGPADRPMAECGLDLYLSIA